MNHRSSAESSRRSLVLFPDDIKPGLVRPFRAVSSQASTANQARPVTGKFETVPNYRTVIGASYDDIPSSKTINDDFEDDVPAVDTFGTVVDDDDNDKKPKNFTKQELYNLCVKEVPDYLRNDLCGSLIETSPPSTTDATTSTTSTSATPTTSGTKSSAKQTAELEPKNSQLIHGNRKSGSTTARLDYPDGVQLEVVTEKSVKQETYLLPGSASNFLGIPLELPVEVKRTSQREEPKLTSESPFKVYRTSAEVADEEDQSSKHVPQRQAQVIFQDTEETTVYQQQQQPFPGYDEASDNIPAAANVVTSSARPIAGLPKPDARQPASNYFSRDQYYKTIFALPAEL